MVTELIKRPGVMKRGVIALVHLAFPTLDFSFSDAHWVSSISFYTATKID